MDVKSTATDGISNFVCLNNDSSTDTSTEAHLTFTVKLGDKDVEGILTFTTGEGGGFSIKATKSAQAYGVTFAPTGTDGGNCNTVVGMGTTNPAITPVVYVQVKGSNVTDANSNRYRHYID